MSLEEEIEEMLDPRDEIERAKEFRQLYNYLTNNQLILGVKQVKQLFNVIENICELTAVLEYHKSPAAEVAVKANNTLIEIITETTELRTAKRNDTREG